MELLQNRVEDPNSLKLDNTADAQAINLEGVTLIELHFPKFTDGRAYSQAHVLRRRGFTGVIRASGDVLVEVTVDEKGQMVDYQIVNAGYMPDMAELRDLENKLVFATYIPATSFGVPVSGKTRVWLSCSHIDVKG